MNFEIFSRILMKVIHHNLKPKIASKNNVRYSVRKIDSCYIISYQNCTKNDREIGYRAETLWQRYRGSLIYRGFGCTYRG